MKELILVAQQVTILPSSVVELAQGSTRNKLLPKHVWYH